MKRVFLPLCCCLVLCLCACTGATQPKDVEINRNFTAKAQINYQSTAYTATIQSTDKGCNAVFSAPDELNGMKISYNGYSLSYELGGLEFEALPPKNATQFLQLIFEVLNALPESTTPNESGYSLSGRLNGCTYYLNISREQLSPVFLEIEGLDLAVNFFL